MFPRDLYFSNNKSLNLTSTFKSWNSQQRVRHAGYKNNPSHVSLTIEASWNGFLYLPNVVLKWCPVYDTSFCSLRNLNVLHDIYTLPCSSCMPNWATHCLAFVPRSSLVQDIFIPTDYRGEAEMKCAMEKQTKFVAVPKRRRGVSKK